MHTQLFAMPALLAWLQARLPHRHPPGAPAQAAPTCAPAAQWLARCGTRLTLRPVQPPDAPLLGELFEDGLSPTARRQRFHAAVRCLSPVQLAWLADADFQRHAAFIVTRQHGGLQHAVAEGRWVRSGGAGCAEFALSVADAWQHQGIGGRLLGTLVGTAKAQGIHSLQGDVLPGNQAMQALAGSLCFDCSPHPDDDGLLRTTLALARPPQPALSVNWFH